MHGLGRVRSDTLEPRLSESDRNNRVKARRRPILQKRCNYFNMNDLQYNRRSWLLSLSKPVKVSQSDLEVPMEAIWSYMPLPFQRFTL